MANSALGAALTIPQSALDAIEQADKKLKDIQDTAKNTAASVTKSFDNMATGTKPFLDALDQVINKLNIVGASATNASGGLNNIGASAGTMSGNITQASMNVQNMVAQLSKMNGSGTSGIMQAALAFQRLQASAKGASGMNIAELKQEIGGIESILKDTSYNLTKADQDALIKRKKSLQDELKYQQQMYNERVVAFQKALDRMVNAEQSYNNKQRKLYTDRAKDYQNKNYKSNTTYQGALDFSATANTLNRQVRAIEYLKEARMKLSTADADYKHKLETLNAAIAEHNKKLKEAGINTKQLGEQTSYMAGYLSRWAQRMAFAFSISSIKGFVGQLAEVRGQFELSQRSLEAILQNKPKADEIFNKTVELAVKSPFRIKDLVDYTRQLSAYRIESDKLYDTTKRLADVSAGLGVDMGRLILAYGQVKAAAYLRGSEVRQFTEAGINMYGELQQYFKEVKGEAYTTAQIVDMISKRKVTFQDVEAIFQRMTDKGGTFYNMQEIQAETLQGKISNLKDAFDVMLNDIGKSNEGLLKGTISSATDLLNHWEAIVNVAKALLSIVVAIKINSMFMQSSLGKAFALDAAMVGRWQAFKNLIMSIPTAFGKMKAAISSIASSLKAALGGVALYAVIQTIMNYRDALQQFDETVRKARENTIDTLGRISELSAKYKELSNSAKTANNTRNNNEDSKVIDEKRKALNKLIEQANKDGLEIKINITELGEKQLDKEFETLKKKYADFVFELEAIKERAAQSDKKGWWWGFSGIKEGLDEYKSATIDIVSQTNKIEKAMALANINYKDANAQTQKYFDTLRKGRIDGEADIDYLKRMNDAWKGLEAYYSRNSMLLPKWLTDGQEYIKDVADSFDDLDSAIKQTQENFKDVFIGKGGVEEFKKKYQKDPIKLRAEINTYANENDLSSTQKQLLMWIATNRYGIKFPVEVDGSNAEPAIKTIIEDLQEYADQNKIKISVDVKDPKNLNETISGYQKSAKDWQETIDNIKRSSKNYFIGAYLDIGNKESWNGQNVDSHTVFPKELALKYAEEQKKAALYWNQFLGGKDPFAEKGGRSNSNKTQRDILQERISLLKDMSSEYQKLIKYEGEEQATADVRKHFALAAKNVGMNINNFIPDRQTIAKKIEYLASQYKELGKRGSALRNATEIRIDIDEEYFKQQLDDAKNNAQEAFSQLDLFNKLKGEGLSDSIIKSMFGDLTSSFDDVRKSITDDFEAKWGKDQTKWGDDVAKEYTSQMQKLDKEVYQDQVNQAQELIKAYKQQLTDQLQLDRWYINERYKLQNNANIAKNPELQKHLQENLNAQYKKKTDENTWKDFKNSDMYVRLFDNLDQVSSKALDAMAERLQQLRTELRDLDPTELKTIAEQINKVNEVRNSRNPFKAFTSGLKEMIKTGKDLKKSGGVEKYVELNGLRADLTSKLQSQNAYVESLEQEYNELAKIKGVDESVVSALKLKLATNKSIRDSLKSQLNLTDEQITKLGTIMTEEEQAKAKFSKSVTDITSVVSTMATAFNGLFEALSGSDANLENTLNIVDNIGQAVGSYYSGNYAGVVSGAMGAITGAIKLFNTKDKKLQKEIERHQKVVDKLKDAYDDLKEAMDNAYDIAKLGKYTDEMVKNLELQNQNLQSMIAAERDKKDTDDSKIEEWQKQIEANNKAIKEAEETLTEQLGGFGSQSNYKSAAEAFAEAWVDAFNEGSDALEALNKKFDEYIKNLVVKQATVRLVGKMIKPVLEAIDEAVAEGSEGGNNGLEVTSSELKKISDLWENISPNLNDGLKSLVEILGYKPGANSNLSALQQGIQSVSEATAQALESIINSIRYFVAQQQSDVAAIRNILEARLGAVTAQGESGGSSNQMIALMEQQAGYLHEICDNWSSVLKGGHKQGGKGIKVFMS